MGLLLQVVGPGVRISPDTLDTAWKHKKMHHGYNINIKQALQNYSETLLFQTSEVQTPCFNEYFAQAQIGFTLMLASFVGPVRKELMQKLSYVLCQQSLFGVDQPITKLLTT